MKEYRGSGKARESWDKWFSKEENKEKHRKSCRRYYALNPDKCIKSSYKYKRNRMGWDINFKLRQDLTTLVNMGLKNQNGKKAFKLKELLSCSIMEAREKIEKQFLEGMTWNNKGEWHIDHIIPCCSFDLNDPIQQKKCYHWSNMRPLWAKDNLKKSSEDKKLKFMDIL